LAFAKLTADNLRGCYEQDWSFDIRVLYDSCYWFGFIRLPFSLFWIVLCIKKVAN